MRPYFGRVTAGNAANFVLGSQPDNTWWFFALGRLVVIWERTIKEKP